MDDKVNERWFVKVEGEGGSTDAYASRHDPNESRPRRGAATRAAADLGFAVDKERTEIPLATEDTMELSGVYSARANHGVSTTPGRPHVEETVNEGGGNAGNVSAARIARRPPRPAQVRPGAYAVQGPNPQHHSDEVSASAPSVNQTVAPVSARLVDPDEESRIIRQRVEEVLREERENAAFAQVVEPANYAQDIAPAVNNAEQSESVSWSGQGGKRRLRIVALLLAALVITSVVVSVLVVVFTRDSPTDTPTFAPTSFATFSQVPALSPVALPLPTVSTTSSPAPLFQPPPSTTNVPSLTPFLQAPTTVPSLAPIIFANSTSGNSTF